MHSFSGECEVHGAEVSPMLKEMVGTNERHEAYQRPLFARM